MQDNRKPPILERLAWIYEMGLVLAVAWLLLFVWSGNSAHAAAPLLAYETAPPGADPSWLVVYNDGRVERDMAPYMKQAGRQAGQLDPVLFEAVQRLVRALLDADASALNANALPDGAGDVGIVTLSVTSGNRSRNISWRPVPGVELNPVLTGIDATLASLLYESL